MVLAVWQCPRTPAGTAVGRCPGRGAGGGSPYRLGWFIALAGVAIITIASGKGGTGKTTLAVNLAALAAGDGGAVIIDADPQSDVPADLGLDTPAPLVSVPSGRPGLSVIAVDSRARGAAQHLGRLQAALAAQPRPRPRWVIVDSPPAAGSAEAAGALMLARWVLMPVRVDRASIEGLGHVMDTVLAHRMAARPLGVVLTMVPVRATRIAAAARAMLDDVLGGVIPVFASMIRTSERATLAARAEGRTAAEVAAEVAAAPGPARAAAAALAGDYAAVWAEAQHRMGNGA